MSSKPYSEVNPNPNFPELEEKIIERWKKEQTFEKSVRGDKDFVFYDGPPFANGLPHYGHLLTGFMKDIVARYQTMKGNKVERRFGWDCHGLPAEMGAEKELGISGKVAIEEYGIDRFNDFCRNSVLTYTKDWEYYVNRQARWVDFVNDYKTMDISFMESTLWAFKQLFDKGLVYESMRVMPYSWACETPVSDFETRMDNSYREKTSKAVTITFKLKEKPKTAPNGFNEYRIMAWTTTPWTLPSNLAAAVGEDLDYVCVSHDNKCYIIAQVLAGKYSKEIGDDVVASIKGADLVGLQYEPLFNYFKDEENAFKVVAGHHVTTEDGTGIVHMAPGFGEDDQIICNENHIRTVCPVDSGAKFIHPVTDYIGQHVFDTNDSIIIKLKEQGNWVRTEQYIHNYPHCWRTDTPLIYRAIPSWYVAVTKFKDRMVELNQQINWIPSHIKDGMFGKWIENARDWSISRNRYWGCPIPIWRSDDPQYPHIEVYGSIEEIEKSFGVKVGSLHRPFIDTLSKTNPSDPTGKSKLVRVPDVLDCWFESGSMPYAQVHYPFENKEWFEKNFPADYIVEYKGQTRGWFYTLLVLSTALFDRPPFKNCTCHGIILGDGGKKLSKRLKNYADPKEVFNSIGSDAMRWYMIASPVMRGLELVIDKEGTGFREAIRTVIKPFWNAYNFFVLYANSDNVKAEVSFASDNLMDRYILSKCAETVTVVEKAMDDYDTTLACKAVEDFFEILNNWYIRRSRERFWKSEKDQDKISAYNTLYTVITTMCRASAPLLPLITEEIYTSLTGEESVHLAHFPKMDIQIDHALIKQMERVREACTAALFLRNEAGIRVRQPLAQVTFIGVSEEGISEELKQQVLDEINVKTWANLDKSKILDFANYKLQIKFPVLGKRLPTKMKDIIAAQKQGNWKLDGGKLYVADEELLAEEYDLQLEPKPEFTVSTASLASNDALVLLDMNISEELKYEGLARDVVRALQQARKDAGLNITDRIQVSLSANDNDLSKAIINWTDYIKEQTLCENLELVANGQGQFTEADIDGRKLSYLIKGL
jgi:isoleucyl-tRNA synthetase